MNFVILKCPLKDNHGLRVSCPWLVSKAQAIDTIRHHTIFLFSIYEPPIILYSSYIKELILLQHILQHRSSNTRTRTRTRTSSNTSSSFLVSSSGSLCSCAVDLGVFGSNLSQVSGFQNSRWRRLASIGVDGVLGVAELGIFGDSLHHDFLSLEFILIYEQVQILKLFKGG